MKTYGQNLFKIFEWFSLFYFLSKCDKNISIKLIILLVISNFFKQMNINTY